MTRQVAPGLHCSGGKFLYGDFPTARRVADHMNDRDRRTGRTTRKVLAYHCANCRGYHVSSHNPKQKWK